MSKGPLGTLLQPSSVIHLNFIHRQKGDIQLQLKMYTEVGKISKIEQIVFSLRSRHRKG